MRTAGVRELKSRLSQYLRQVKQGETVLVTEHGDVVAQLGPPGPDERAPADAPGRRLRKLIAEGRVRPPTARPGDRFPARPTVTLSKKDFERLWDDARGDGEL